MRNIEVIIMLPLAVVGLLLLMVVDLVRMVRGKQTADEEWYQIYVDGNLNHGQGAKE